MSFQIDDRFVTHGPKGYGEYLTTFLSEPSGQVRADIFRNGGRVFAHVSFPEEFLHADPTETYGVELRDYARAEGVADCFQIVYSESARRGV